MSGDRCGDKDGKLVAGITPVTTDDCGPGYYYDPANAGR